MFSEKHYLERRKKLRVKMEGENILIFGHSDNPKNYHDNIYPFRQNSNFLYFAGHQIPDMALVMTEDEDILFGHKPTMDDIIWTGSLPTLQNLGERCGVDRVMDISELASFLQKLKNKVHYLPPYRGESVLFLSQLLDQDPRQIKKGHSPELMKAVADLRNVKSKEEINEIEFALSVSKKMYDAAINTIRPGIYEYDIKEAIAHASRKEQCDFSFPPIVTIHGEVLHSHTYSNQASTGGLILIDSGAETPEGYASDITRTFPVNGEFAPRQKDIYEIVLSAQKQAIEAAAPGVMFRDMHLISARVITEGLTDLGLMKGDSKEAVRLGAHALFYPHGLGHMMGLDVHDMEDLGDIVGYGPDLSRSQQFGLAALRMARKLEPGFVFTVEPGIYFIPALIKQWRSEKKFAEFINYEKVQKFMDFGGIRIEDDLLVTEKGYRILGEGIVKKPKEIETEFSGR
ncbi:MAG: aminopeptidase P family protein [Myxococcota bacterium]